MMRAVRFVRAWACWVIVVRLWPHGQWANPIAPDSATRRVASRLFYALLPHVGDWAFAEDQRALGRDPWGPR